MKIRKYQQTDWKQVWAVIEPVFRAGDSHPFLPSITEKEAYHVWIELPQETYVAVSDDSTIVGTYLIRPNQPGLGSHVCNCGYVVAENARRKGLGSAMCEHSQKIAIQLGFTAMQYNLVVSTNKTAANLWKKQGFQLIGILPKAFFKEGKVYVDAFVMYKDLAMELDKTH